MNVNNEFEPNKNHKKTQNQSVNNRDNQEK